MRHYYNKDSQQSTKKLVSFINLEHKNNFDYLFVIQIALLQFKKQEDYYFLKSPSESERAKRQTKRNITPKINSCLEHR